MHGARDQNCASNGHRHEPEAIEARVALSPMEAFSRKFNITAAELRVLLAIVNVGGVAEVAEILGIGEGTVRTHLHHLFEKTGARRQVDLVKLVPVPFCATRTRAGS